MRKISPKAYLKMRKWLLLTKKLQKEDIVIKVEYAGNEMDIVVLLNLKGNDNFRK
jgi:hypothetical protein